MRHMMRKGLLITIAMLATVAYVSVVPASAECTTAAECITTGVDNTNTNSSTKNDSIGSIITTVVSILMFVVGSIAVVMMVVGGIKYSVSQGDSGSIQAAKNTILYSLAGLVVAIASYALVAFVVGAFGGINNKSTVAETPAPPPVRTPTSSPPNPKPATGGGTTTPTPTTKPTTGGTQPTTTYMYKNGTYSASVDYSAKGHPDTISTTITVTNDKVTSVSIDDNPDDSTSASYVDDFKAAVSSAVVGKSLNGLSPSRIGGASLTTTPFNKTLDMIRVKAKA